MLLDALTWNFIELNVSSTLISCYVVLFTKSSESE